jgi:antitoxin component of RelBE/YafQ-DinJ toxin-antitoxin module
MLQDVATEIRSVWEKIIANTKWPLDLVIPSEYRQAKQIEQIKSNKYINVLFYNSVNCSDYNDKTKQFNLFNENKLAPPAQTVLNTAVYFGIFWRYKTIVLIGADTSWHKQIEVDQKTNMLYMKDAHFYGVNKRSLYKNVERTVPARIHEEFYSIARALEAYWLLREYAEFNSTTIYNASGKSYIDAFERKPLKTILAE